MSKTHDISDIDISHDLHNIHPSSSPLAIEDTPATNIAPSSPPPSATTNSLSISSTPNLPINLSKPSKPALLYPKLDPVENPDCPNPNLQVSLYPSLEQHHPVQLFPKEVVGNLELQINKTENQVRIASFATPKASSVALVPSNTQETFFTPQQTRDLPVKRKKERSRSVDSPRNSDEDLELTFSERSPQTKKPTKEDTRRVLTKSYIRIVRTLAKDHAELENRKHLLTTADLQKLQEKVKQHKDEKQELQNRLLQAELSVSTLTQKGILLEASVDAALALAKQQTNELLTKLQASNEEKYSVLKEQEEIQNQLSQYYLIQLQQKDKIIELHQEVFNKENTKNQENLKILEYQLDVTRNELSQENFTLKSNWNTEVKSLTEIIAKEQENKQLLEENLRKTTHENNFLRGQLTRCENSNSESETYLKELQENLQFSQHKQAETAGELESLIQLLNDTKARNSQAVADLQRQNTLIAELENKIAEQDNNIQQLRANNPENLQLQYTKTITKLNLEKDTLHAKLAKLTDTYKAEKTKTDQELSSIQTTVNISKKKLSTLETQNADLLQTKAALTNEIESLK